MILGTARAALRGGSAESREALGAIQGDAGYPSNGVPALHIYAISVDGKNAFRVDTAANTIRFTIPNVPSGTYYVVGFAPDFGLAGGYTRAVLCGLRIECTDHTLIAVAVSPGQTVAGIKLTDWYAPPGAIPPEPGGSR
jgi:hypothetical protein